MKPTKEENILRDLREDHDLTQKEIASKLNVAVSTYSNYENLRRNIPAYLINCLAGIYGVSAAMIVIALDRKNEVIMMDIPEIY
ncbi:MAG: helix-turn-helix transcriptional regulator [Lachnospiraceae bacterium]|nr:helix-turn-helix transcriptional regulator [Lachnospiraceae bacterium]